MTNIRLTIYTQDKGRLDLTQEECHNFTLNTVTLHRTNSPAVIRYHKDGSIRCKLYYINDKLHRLDGPSIIWYYQYVGVDREYYFINNKFYKKEDYYNLINEMKALPKTLKLVHEDWWVREL